MTNFLVASDNIDGYSQDAANLQEVIDILNSNGHSAESGGVASSSLQDACLSTNASGKVGVTIVGGICVGTAYDFHVGIGSYYHCDSVIFAVALWSGAFHDVNCGNLGEYVPGKSWDDNFSGELGGFDSMSINQIMETAPEIKYVCGSTPAELAQKISDGDYTGGSGSSDSKTKKIGFDKDNPFKGYWKVGYSLEPGSQATVNDIYFDFSADSAVVDRSFEGFTPIWLNNRFKHGYINILDPIRSLEGDFKKEKDYYLRRVSLVYDVPVDKEGSNTVSSTSDSKEQEDNSKNLYDSSTDDATYKMLLKQIGLRSGDTVNPTTLGTNGKSILSNINTILDSGVDYGIKMNFGEYREDDSLEFFVNTTDPKLTLNEQDSTFLNITNTNYTPVEKMFNSSYRIYKRTYNDGSSYNRWANSRNPLSILLYGEKCDTETVNGDSVSGDEAYYQARYANEKLNADLSTTYTVQYAGIPNLNIGDYAECILDDTNLSDVKKVCSIEYDISIDEAVHVRTSIGLDEMDTIIKGRTDQMIARREAKEKSNIYSKGAVYDITTSNKTEFL